MTVLCKSQACLLAGTCFSPPRNQTACQVAVALFVTLSPRAHEELVHLTEQQLAHLKRLCCNESNMQFEDRDSRGVDVHRMMHGFMTGFARCTKHTTLSKQGLLRKRLDWCRVPCPLRLTCDSKVLLSAAHRRVAETKMENLHIVPELVNKVQDDEPKRGMAGKPMKR